MHIRLYTFELYKCKHNHCPQIPRQPTPSNIAPSTRQSSAKERTVVEPEAEIEEETKQEEATLGEKGNEDLKENPGP